MDIHFAHAPLLALHGVDQLFGLVAESRPGSRWEVAAIARGSRTLGFLRQAGTEKCSIFVPDFGCFPEPYIGTASFFNAHFDVAQTGIALGAISGFHRDTAIVATKFF